MHHHTKSDLEYHETKAAIRLNKALLEIEKGDYHKAIQLVGGAKLHLVDAIRITAAKAAKR